MANYPVKQTYAPTYNRKSSYLPAINPSCLNTPNVIIPHHSKNHNIAGQIKTHIQMKNARGEEINIYQAQQVLNLLDTAKGDWFVYSDDGARNFKKHRKGLNRTGK